MLLVVIVVWICGLRFLVDCVVNGVVRCCCCCLLLLVLLIFRVAAGAGVRCVMSWFGVCCWLLVLGALIAVIVAMWCCWCYLLVGVAWCLLLLLTLFVWCWCGRCSLFVARRSLLYVVVWCYLLVCVGVVAVVGC